MLDIRWLLEQNIFVTHFILSNNKITDNGLIAILEILTNIESNLMFLDAGYNLISDNFYTNCD